MLLMLLMMRVLQHPLHLTSAPLLPLLFQSPLLAVDSLPFPGSASLTSWSRSFYFCCCSSSLVSPSRSVVGALECRGLPLSFRISNLAITHLWSLPICTVSFASARRSRSGVVRTRKRDRSCCSPSHKTQFRPFPQTIHQHKKTLMWTSVKKLATFLSISCIAVSLSVIFKPSTGRSQTPVLTCSNVHSTIQG